MNGRWFSREGRWRGLTGFIEDGVVIWSSSLPSFSPILSHRLGNQPSHSISVYNRYSENDCHIPGTSS